MFPTLVNCATVIIGSLLGLLLAGRISEKYKAAIFDGAGTATIIIGVSMSLASQRIIYVALALIAGGLLGTAADVDGAILRFGSFLERISLRRRDRPAQKAAAPATSTGADVREAWDFGHGFLNASVLFCVGAMALLGSFQAGTEGNYTLLLTKSVLDGFMAILLAAAMGPGVAFSALPVFVYQAVLTLGASTVKPFVSELMISELTGIGGAMVLMIGFNLLSLKKIKTANFLPALVLVVLFALFDPDLIRLGAWLGL